MVSTYVVLLYDVLANVIRPTVPLLLEKKRDVKGGGRSTLRSAKCATPHTASRTIAYCKLNITYGLFCCLHYVILHACLLLPAAVVLLIAEVTDGRTEPKGANI